MLSRRITIEENIPHFIGGVSTDWEKSEIKDLVRCSVVRTEVNQEICVLCILSWDSFQVISEADSVSLYTTLILVGGQINELYRHWLKSSVCVCVIYVGGPKWGGGWKDDIFASQPTGTGI
jgi:hypothetical protein